MTPTQTDRVTGSQPNHIYVSERPGRHGIQSVIGRDLVIEPRILSKYCFRELDPRIDDLVLIAGAVAFADRVIPRRLISGWPRRLEITVSVHNPEFWEQDAILRNLIGTLDLLTGDIWDFRFRSGRTKTPVTIQPSLPLSDNPPIVMPYSDGLDSFAGARLLALDSRTKLILVTTGQKADADVCEGHNVIHRVAIPFRFRHQLMRFREPSYRSRAFLFGIMTGIAAYLLDAHQIVIPESGQGALGPWLLPVGNEAPDIRMHPLFTIRLSKFFEIVFQTRFDHCHPNLWRTKGETLRELAQQGLSDGWWKTRSCARDARHATIEKHRVQCGTCASCLLRRQSLLAAGLPEEKDSYLWPNLAANTLAAAAAPGARTTTKNDIIQSACAVADLNHLAALADPHQQHHIQMVSVEFARELREDYSSVVAKMTRLIQIHRDEWKSFVAKQGDQSFIAQWLGALSC